MIKTKKKVLPHFVHKQTLQFRKVKWLAESHTSSKPDITGFCDKLEVPSIDHNAYKAEENMQKKNLSKELEKVYRFKCVS